MKVLNSESTENVEAIEEMEGTENMEDMERTNEEYISFLPIPFKVMECMDNPACKRRGNLI